MDRRERYFRILDGLKPSTQETHKNSRILLIDGLNTFIRSFAVNPSSNDDGVHIGGMTGFLQSIGYAIRNIRPTRVIICWDGKGGSTRRRKMFPDYKANRRVRTRLTRMSNYGNVGDEQIAMGQQIRRLTQYLETLPVTVMATENIEADDAIAYICEQIYPESQKFIMSTDKDYLQLVNDKVQVWSPTKKKFYFQETILEEFGVPANNFLEYRTLLGDSSDNIPGIKGTGLKTLQKRLPIIFGDKKITIDDILRQAEDNKSDAKILATIAESGDILRLNYKLMQLREVDISGHAKSSILDIVRRPIQRLNKPKFLTMFLEDKINSTMKNPEFWLQDTWRSLDSYSIVEDKNE
tara:strand:- start:127 stop:1182 length:1056 start_codon:yes stop_codon:yes gene_type:complete